MKNFFKTLVASLVGTITAISIFSLLALLIVIGVLSGLTEKYQIEENTVLKLDLNGSLADRDTENLFATILEGGPSINVKEMVQAIRIAKNNPKIKAVYIYNGHLSTGIAFLEPLRAALLDFKESGKPVIAYGDSYLQSCYYISSVADKIIMNPYGTLSFRGLSSNIKFSKNYYDNLGIHYQVFKVGTFKSAVEPYTETKMSEANRQQVTSFINDVWSHLLKGISSARNIAVDSLNRYADEFLSYSEPEKLIEYKMIDTLMYKQDVEVYLKQYINSQEKIKMATVKNLCSAPDKGKKDAVKDKIAVVYADGSIVKGDSKSGLSLFGNVISDGEYVKELTKLKDDDEIKAVVLRINSGGGSAYASEQIWKAVSDLKKKKPVIVSMGNYAASGGYYIACAANKIIAEPTTLTGSIGVFGLIPEGQDMHRKIGWTYDQVSTNKHSDFGFAAHIPFLAAMIRPFNEEEKIMIQGSVERTYNLFLTRCAEGRSKTKSEIDAIGQGRVWTGAQAVSIGLVDELGGLDKAIEEAAKYAGIQQYDVADYPETKSLFEQLIEGAKEGDAKAAIVKYMLGKEVYQQYMLSNSTGQSSDAIMALMSSDIE